MINYVERGIGMHELIDAAGYRLWQEADGWHSTDDVAVQAIIDSYTDADRKAWELARVEPEIRAERDRRLLIGCTVGGHGFQGDADSKFRQFVLFSMGANIPPGTVWRTREGVAVPMTQALAAQVFQAQAVREAMLFAASDAHITAARAVERPIDYDYSSGWPA